MRGDSAFWSHPEVSRDTAAPALRAPAVAALRALVELAAADGVRVELEVPATGERVEWPASWPLPSARVRDGSGSGVGVHAHEGESAADEAARAADTVHEHLVEHRPGAGRSSSWPSCPLHPETHPRAIAPGGDDDARPRWTCPRTGGVLGRLG